MYNVEWIRIAHDAFLDLWTEADDPEQFAAAMDHLSQRLALNPVAAGESRPRQQRVAFELPLAVRYTIRPAERRVMVLAVWRVPRRR